MKRWHFIDYLRVLLNGENWQAIYEFTFHTFPMYMRNLYQINKLLKMYNKVLNTSTIPFNLNFSLFFGSVKIRYIRERKNWFYTVRHKNVPEMQDVVLEKVPWSIACNKYLTINCLDFELMRQKIVCS